MYTILFAEDEPAVLSAIIETIPWEKHGFETPLACLNGQEAIEKIENGFSPDLIITDICMPIADGLALSKFANKAIPNALIVILSGYDDFHYAQAALKLKVQDYLLKPVLPQQMEDILELMRKELDKRQEEQRNPSRKILKDHFLYQLMTQRLDSDFIKERMQQNDLVLRGKFFLAAAADVDFNCKQQDPQEIDCLRYALFNIAAELTENRDDMIVFQGKIGVTILLFGGEEEKALLKSSYELIQMVGQTFRHSLSMSISAGLGLPVKEMDALYLSHKQCRQALEERFYNGEGSILLYSPALPSSSFFYEQWEADVLQEIRAGKTEKVEEKIDQGFLLLEKAHLGRENVIRYIQQLADNMIRSIEELSQSTWEDNVFSDSLQNMYFLKEIRKTIHDLEKRLFEKLQETAQNTATLQIRKAKDYILANYQDPSLSLSGVTEHLAVSVSYFSSLFKAQTGKTFLEFLTNLRMEKACHILTFTDQRSYEVAEAVGFSDPHYFSIAFKRATGLSPRQYREKSRKEINPQQ